MDETTLKLSPRARRLAHELGVDLADLAGLGKTPIREEDVRALASRRSALPEADDRRDAETQGRAEEATGRGGEQGTEAGLGSFAVAAGTDTPPGAPPEESAADAAPDDFETLVEGPSAAEMARRADEVPSQAEVAAREQQHEGEDTVEADDLPAAPIAALPPVTPSPPHPLTPSSPLPPPPEEDEILALTPIRKVIAGRALASARDVPQFSLWIDVDVGAALQGAGGDLVRARAAWVHAAARALTAHPRLNASFTPEGIRLHKAIHVGITVPLEDGIVVPVLHDAGRKSKDEIEAELRDLEERAHTRRLRGEHLSGATFHLSDWSAMGVRGGVPLLNPPQVALLGIGAPRDIPFLRNGGLFFRPMCEVVLVADQRALDASHAAAFLTFLKSEIEA